MKSTVEQLSNKEVEALVRFYDTDAFNALSKLCKLEIEGLGKDALASPNHEQTKFYSGQAAMAAKLIKIVRGLYKEHEKNKEAKKKN